MIKTLLKYFALTTVLFLISCDTEIKDSSTYFGGKIINPKSKFVVLYSLEKPIDTFHLNNKNKFLGKLTNVKEGLYHFMHGSEYQYIYIEPQDSIMLRLNTWDFDESLVYAGKGADRNNILIDCFLEEEKESKNFYSYNKLDPTKYTKVIDSLIELKEETLENYIKNHPKETDKFNSILKIALTFPIYSNVEKYPLIYAKYSKDKAFPKIDKSLFNYRNTIEINNDSLMYYPPYSQYVRNYLYNETYSLGHPPIKNSYSPKFTIDLLNIIDKKLTSENSKNAFLKQTVISHFYQKSSCDVNKDPFEKYFELSTNDFDKKHVKQLLNDSKAISINKSFNDFCVVDYTNSKKQIKSVIKDKNSFLFFWNPEFVSEAYIVTRMDYLSKKYNNIKFVQIKIDGNMNDKIDKLDIKNQFYLDDSCSAHDFLTSKMPRSILVNKQGKVVNGYASISSYNINQYLKELNKN